MGGAPPPQRPRRLRTRRGGVAPAAAAARHAPSITRHHGWGRGGAARAARAARRGSYVAAAARRDGRRSGAGRPAARSDTRCAARTTPQLLSCARASPTLVRRPCVRGNVVHVARLGKILAVPARNIFTELRESGSARGTWLGLIPLFPTWRGGSAHGPTRAPTSCRQPPPPDRDSASASASRGVCSRTSPVRSSPHASAGLGFCPRPSSVRSSARDHHRHLLSMPQPPLRVSARGHPHIGSGPPRCGRPFLPSPCATLRAAALDCPPAPSSTGVRR